MTTVNIVKTAAEAELNRAIEIHGFFHSAHEGWAVLLEEILELSQLISNQTDPNNQEKPIMDFMFDCVMSNDYESISRCVKNISETTFPIALEAIQVLAMCEKFRVYLKAQETDKASV